MPEESLNTLSIENLLTRFAQATFLLTGTKEEESFQILAEIKNRKAEKEFEGELQHTYGKKINDVFNDEFSGTELQIAQDIWQTGKPQHVSSSWLNRTVGFFMKGPESMLETYRDHPSLSGAAALIIGIPLFLGTWRRAIPILITGGVLSGGAAITGLIHAGYHEWKAGETQDTLEKYQHHIESGKGFFGLFSGGLGAWLVVRNILAPSQEMSNAAPLLRDIQWGIKSGLKKPTKTRIKSTGVGDKPETIGPEIGKNSDKNPLTTSTSPACSYTTAPSVPININRGVVITSKEMLDQILDEEMVVKYAVVETSTGVVLRVGSINYTQHANLVMNGEKMIGAGKMFSFMGEMKIDGQSGYFPTLMSTVEKSTLPNPSPTPIAERAGLSRVAQVFQSLLGIKVEIVKDISKL